MPGENKVKPCPFCGCIMVELVRPGTPRQSCIVACADCGCRLESNEIGALEAWNRRVGTMEDSQTPINNAREEIAALANEVEQMSLLPFEEQNFSDIIKRMRRLSPVA